MNFLVILICLAINTFWLKDFDRFDDSWVFKLRRRIEQYVSNLPSNFRLAWLIGTIIVYATPTFLLVVLLLVVADSAYGVLTMIIHILVLLMTFDRIQLGRLVSNFLSNWNDADMEACARYLQDNLVSMDSTGNITLESLLQEFKKFLTYRCFENIFVMLFWYMLAGPIAILFCYINYQLRDSHSPDQNVNQINLVSVIIGILEWVPMRLVAITFSLAGNFESGFKSVKEKFWVFSKESDNTAQIFNYANCALSIGTVFNTDSDLDSVNDKSRTKVVREIRTLQGLLERSQVIWLSILALITIFGLRL